ncbi:pyruvate dehydrogenase complex dihydrolipoamide acetyltransferase [bacterium]|nr:MAG: pyruvate dehydrogenase complex dihydrolipoamide acetyltransferase [bacterium]
MAIVIEMPKLSDTMQEGVIAKWNVKEGDAVKSGDIIAEVETDKATMDVEVYDGGTILKLMVAEGDAVALGGTMAIIGKPGEDISSLLGGSSAKTPTAAPKEEVKEDVPVQAAPVVETTQVSEDGRIKASPLARKIAEDKGIDLASVNGSGPEGRIVKADVENFAPKASAPVTSTSPTPVASALSSSQTAYTDSKISQMRKTIAKRLAESKFTNPHFYETIDIDMKNAIKVREQLNTISDVKISFNDFVVKASAVALKKHPKVNSSWLGDVIRQYHSVHVAVAVAIEDGLVTPVIRDTNTKGLTQISKETKDLALRARDRKLAPEEWEGSTFTISNLGMYGIEEFTAIINPPNACILAVGAIRDVPVVEDGAVVPGKRMKVTLSSDHRVVDGATSAEFLQTLKGLLENPMGMLL